jgi:hypothetical protein
MELERKDVGYWPHAFHVQLKLLFYVFSGANVLILFLRLLQQIPNYQKKDFFSPVLPTPEER